MSSLVSPPFTPRLDILPEPQLRVWRELGVMPDSFVLYGGTAIALHLGHRQSVDFDLFSNLPFDPDDLLDLPPLKGAVIIEKAPNTLTMSIERDGPVKLSFFGVPKLKRLRPPLRAPDNHLQVASLLDLAGTKAAVVQKRAEAKDYIDIEALLSSGALTLSDALAAGAALYGERFSPEVTLKALCYFGEETLRDLDEEVKHRLIAAVRGVNLNELPRFE